MATEARIVARKAARGISCPLKIATLVTFQIRQFIKTRFVLDTGERTLSFSNWTETIIFTLCLKRASACSYKIEFRDMKPSFPKFWFCAPFYHAQTWPNTQTSAKTQPIYPNILQTNTTRTTISPRHPSPHTHTHRKPPKQSASTKTQHSSSRKPATCAPYPSRSQTKHLHHRHHLTYLTRKYKINTPLRRRGV